MSLAPIEGFLSRRRAAAGVLLFVLAIFPTAAAWWVHGPPLPGNCDEYSYILAARTFAAGRFANPPLDPAVFGPVFCLTAPTFAVKFQPGQGLLLAAGKRVFGHEYAGVLLSIGLLTLALWWMAHAFAPPVHAFVIGLFAALSFGLFHYWSTTYWGGALPCTGAALAVGAWARWRERWTAMPAALLACGASLLFLTRPFEGSALTALLLLDLGLVFLSRWRNHKRPALGAPFAFVAVMALTGLFQSAYNYSVTGRLLLMPYVQYNSQFQQAPHFWFVPVGPPKQFPNASLETFHAVSEMKTYEAFALSDGRQRVRLLFERFLRSLDACIPIWSFPLLALFAFAWRDTLARVLAAFALIQSVILLGETWLFPHYMAALVPVLLALLIRCVYVVGSRLRIAGPLLAITALALLVPILRFAPDLYHGPYLENVQLAGDSGGALRIRLERRLQGLGGRHLVLVRYDYSHDFFDWVYNDPIPDQSPIIWARDLGVPADSALRQSHPSRTCWTLDVRTRPESLQPCGQ